ncbi:MAG: hypothetical protein FJX74_02650 [Armatimonadetes bacterium]|nr:hypothetical protein [Armatimonadota bacterium]
MSRMSAVVRGSFMGVLAAFAFTGAARADVDERIKPLLEEMTRFIAEPEPVFLRQRIEVAVNAQKQQEQLQEVWLQDLEHLRMERSDETVVVVTPEDIKMYIGPPRVLVHIPQATLEGLGEQRDEALQALGISRPADTVRVMVEGAEHLAVTGEDTIAEEACWVVTVGEPLFPHFRKSLSSIPEDFSLKTILLAIGRETGVSRSTFFEFTGPAQLEIGITVEEIAEDVEIADDLFTFEAPDDALVLTWTLDKTPEQMRKERDEAIANRMK